MVLSFDTLLVRLIDSNEWTLIFWRGFLPAAMLFIVQWFSDKKLITQHLQRPSLLTLITAGLFSASTICFVLSLNNTQVASTLVITNTAPLFTAVIGFFFLKEKLDKASIFAIIIAVGGIGNHRSIFFHSVISAAVLEYLCSGAYPPSGSCLP